MGPSKPERTWTPIDRLTRLIHPNNHAQARRSILKANTMLGQLQKALSKEIEKQVRALFAWYVEQINKSAVLSEGGRGSCAGMGGMVGRPTCVDR